MTPPRAWGMAPITPIPHSRMCDVGKTTFVHTRAGRVVPVPQPCTCAAGVIALMAGAQ